MSISREEFIVDKQGNKTAVLLDIKSYEKLLEAWGRTGSFRAYDTAKVSNDEVIPISQAMEEIRPRRK